MKPTRIAFISNSNNFNFAILRYLRDKGWAADLILTEDETSGSHYHPSRDSFDDEYLKYSKTVKWGSTKKKFLFSNPFKRSQIAKKIREDLAGYDFFICSMGIPAYLSLANMPVHIFMPLGFDAREMPLYRFKRKYKSGLNFLEWNTRAFYQRKGIRNSVSIITGVNSHGEIKSLEPKGKIFHELIPGFYFPQYEKKEIDKEQVLKRYIPDYQAGDFIVFSQNRQGWRWYGNDQLAQGFKKFLAQNKGARAYLLMFEFGWDLGKSKKMIADLKLEENVIWLSKMPRYEVIDIVRSSNVLGNELVPLPVIQSGSLMEGFALGIPNIQYRLDDEIENLIDSLPPILNARNPDDIAVHLNKCYNEPDYCRDIGSKAKIWFEKHVNASLEIIISEYLSQNEGK